MNCYRIIKNWAIEQGFFFWVDYGACGDLVTLLKFKTVVQRIISDLMEYSETPKIAFMQKLILLH